MKKIYLSALSLAVAVGASAQIANMQLAPKGSILESNKVTSPYFGSFQKATLWSNDISVAADWAFTNTSSPAQDWYIETDPAAVPNNGPVAMQTASNGYLMIDSDAAGQSAAQDAYAEYTGTLDFTGEPLLTLEFQQHYRTYLDERYVEVSGDGGTTWTTYTITDGSSGGDVVSGSESIDISAVAGNSNNVKIRFHYVGSWGWHWAVDDILIKTTEPYDLRADGTAWGSTGSWGLRIPYYNIPTAQIQPIEFCGINSNIGFNDVSDATYNVDIASAGYSSTGTINSVAGETDTICATAAFTPAGVGSFTASASMTTSNNDTGINNNDFDDITFGVNDYIYARDNGDAVIDGGYFRGGDQYEVGNIFDVYTDASLTGIQVGIASTTDEATTVFASVYTVDPSTGDFVLQAQSTQYQLDNSEIGTIINLPLVGGAYPVTAGESYLVMVGTPGNGGLPGTNDLVVMTSGDSPAETGAEATSFLYAPVEANGPWFYTTVTTVVRMNFDPSLSVNENESVLGMEVFPNPANTDANVSFSLNNAANVNITITDLSGKVVYTDNLGNVSAGTTEVSLNTAALSNGVYMINVAADNAVSTEKLVIRK